MGNNASRAEQCSEAPEKPTYAMCGEPHELWPHKTCTREVGHVGNHCSRRFAGTKWIELWWARKGAQ